MGGERHVQGFRLEYLRYGDADKQGGRGKKHGTTDRLLRLANDATLREELTSFPLAQDADDAIPAVHRSGMLFTGAESSKSCICHTMMRSP